MNFSIIVPAYNVQNLIGDCIQSILWQDYPKEQYEILIVEDCSTDSTLQVISNLLDYTRTNYPSTQIRLIKHKQNMHLGGARNTGIRQAKGDYLLFVDSDDYFSGTNVLKEFHDVINKGDCSFVRSSSVHTVAFDSKPIERREERNPKIDYFESEAFILSSNYCNEVWKGCYNRKFLLENNLFFREHVAYEDADWMFKVCASAKSIALIDFPFYCYRSNPESITMKPKKQHFIDNIQSNYYLYNEIIDSQITEASKKKLFAGITHSVIRFVKIANKYTLYDSVDCLRTIPRSMISKELKDGQKKIVKISLYLLVRYPLLIMLVVKSIYPIKRFINIISK